jgi:hypothetical protein
MEPEILKQISGKPAWLILAVLILYFAYKIVILFIEKKNEKAKKEKELAKDDLLHQFQVVTDSINNKLKIISTQYGCELSKDACVIIIQLVYSSFANDISDEFYRLQKRDGYSHDKIMEMLTDKHTILNSEKMNELDNFMYRTRHLITYTTGKIVDVKDIIKRINQFGTKNGTLREEIQNLLKMEADIVIKRILKD